eukprot:5598239-Pleurochrysis_carterae.AAC.4
MHTDSVAHGLRLHAAGPAHRLRLVSLEGCRLEGEEQRAGEDEEHDEGVEPRVDGALDDRRLAWRRDVVVERALVRRLRRRGARVPRALLDLLLVQQELKVVLGSGRGLPPCRRDGGRLGAGADADSAGRADAAVDAGRARVEAGALLLEVSEETRRLHAARGLELTIPERARE